MWLPEHFERSPGAHRPSATVGSVRMHRCKPWCQVTDASQGRRKVGCNYVGSCYTSCEVGGIPFGVHPFAESQACREALKIKTEPQSR